MGFLNTNSMPRLVEKLADGDNIKITGNSKGNRVGTVIKKIVEKADDVTKAVEQEVVNNSHSFKVGTGDVDVSTDVEDGFGEVGVKGVTYQNLIPNLIDSRWKVKGSAIKDRTDLVNGVKLVITSEGSCVLDLIDISMFKPNTKYTLLVNIDTNFTEIRLSNILSSFVKLENGFNCVTFLTKSDFNEMHTCFRIGYTGSLSTGLYMTIKDLIVLEGDYTNNPNLPSYFEGIVGVGDKSKNLFNGKLQIGGINGANGANEDNSTRLRTDFIEISNTTISTKSYEENLDVRLYFFYDSQKRFIQSNAVNTTNLYSTTAPSNTKYIRVVFANKDLNYSFSHSNYTNIQIQEGSAPTEYQPYGTHKIEILSNGKNLFDIQRYLSDNENSQYYKISADGGLEILKLDGRSSFKNLDSGISVKRNTAYSIKCSLPWDSLRVLTQKNNVWSNIKPTNYQFYSGDSDMIYIKFVENENFPKVVTHIQVEESSTPSSYQPYFADKTQILLDEPLMRLPNGVCDEITRDGKLIRRVEKVVLDGSENWNLADGNKENTIRFSMIPQIPFKISTEAISDKFPYYQSTGNDVECFTVATDTRIHIRITRSKLNVANVQGFKEWLSQNPTTVYYELETPIVEELPAPYLRIFKDGHLTFNSLVAPESTHVVQLNKSAQIERSIREVQSLDSRVGKLESFYDDMMLETNHKLSLLNYDFEYTRERNGE